MLSHWIQAVMCHLYARQRKTQAWFIFLHIITLYSLAFWQFISPFYCEEALERGTTATRYIFTPNICLLIRVSKLRVYASMLIWVLHMQCKISTVYCVCLLANSVSVVDGKISIIGNKERNIENVFARWEETVKTRAALLQYTKHNMVLLKNKTTLDICTAA